MSARTEVVELLAKALPDDVVVIAYSHDIDAPHANTVMVRVDRVVPSPAGQGLRTYEMSLVLVSALTSYGPGDDAVDDLLEDVLFALSDNDTPAGVTWTEARRAVYEESNPAYEIALQVTISTEQE